MKKEIIKTEETAVAVAPTQEALDLLKQSFPAEVGYDKLVLPRIGFSSQDKMTGTGKEKKCEVEAGTFFEEVETAEQDENKKNIWKKTELGKEIDLTILYSRRQLKYWDANLEVYTSSNVFDTDDEIITLFSGGAKVMEGNVAELKKRYEYRDDEGKTKSKLEDSKILMVLYKGKIYNLTIRGSSMWSFKTWARSTSTIPAQLTRLSSEFCEKGKIQWNKMTFTKVRDLDAEEVDDVQGKVDMIRNSIAAEKAYYAKDKTIMSTPIPYPTEDSSAGAKSFS